MRLENSVNVGIGTTTPSEKHQINGNVKVSGQLYRKATVISGGTTNIDWNNGNVISTDYDCGAPFIFTNLREGETYTLIGSGAEASQCNFNNNVLGGDAATVV